MPKLAINGGSPAIQDKLRTQWPVFDELEERELLDVLRSGSWCSMGGGGRVERAMNEFARLVGTPLAMGCSSGTTAIEVALRACGVDRGDEVIMPAATFLATATAIACAGATPIFVDIDPETYQIAPDAIEAAITTRTTAILPVHYGGYPADMDRINDIAGRHNLAVVEDCAEAFGSEWRGKRVGSLGTAGAYSFQMGKPLTGGEGGAITYSDAKLSIGQYHYKATRRDGTVIQRAIGNWRMSEFVGAVLLAQFTRIEAQTDQRHENAKHLAEGLRQIGGIEPLKDDPRITKQGFYFYLMRYQPDAWNDVPRDRFMAALKAEGVSCHLAHNDPVYRYPAFEESPDFDASRIHCPETERIHKSEVVAMGKDFLIHRENVDRVLGAIQKLRDNVTELTEK